MVPIPLYSVQSYVKGLLDGLVIADAVPALKAYITPPVVDSLDGPRAHVWGGRMRGRRQTMPRGQAYKRLDWMIDVYLVYEMNPDQPATTIDMDFPLIIDTVMNKTWTTTMPTFIDPNGVPVTVAQAQANPSVTYSEILAIGEDFELEYEPERNPATLRMLYYTARLGLDVYEAVQG